MNLDNTVGLRKTYLTYLDNAFKVVALFYSLFLDFGFLFFLAIQSKTSVLYITLGGFAIFFIHALYTQKYNLVLNWNTFLNSIPASRRIYSAFFNLLISFALSIYLLSFVDSSVNDLYKIFGDQALRSDLNKFTVYLFLLITFLFLLKVGDMVFNKYKNRFVSLLYVISILVLYRYGVDYLLPNGSVSLLPPDFGYFLLGPINLLIANLLLRRTHTD